MSFSARRYSLCVAAWCCLVLACDGDAQQEGGVFDGGPFVDSGSPATPTDASTPRPDAGAPGQPPPGSGDAGVPAPDAGNVDSGNGPVMPVPPDDGDAGEGGVDAGGTPPDAGMSDSGMPVPPGKVPPRGQASTLDVGSWNIEWLGETGQGPTNEALQVQNARDVLAGTDLDIWGVAEVVSKASFDQIKNGMAGFDGFLANDARVTDGADYYDEAEQKVGILFRSSVATLKSASVVLTAQAASFAGRPPLEARLTVSLGGVTREVSVLVLHMKAFDDAASWEKRKAASDALKTYLDTSHATDDVIVVGDFNDTVKGSIVSGKDSPYQNFVTDTDYRFASDALTAGTTVGRTTAIDHHLLTNELFGRYVVGSVEAYRVDMFITDYANTTSDHYPVVSRYQWK